MTGKILIKKGLSFLLAHCGVFSLLERRRLRDKAFVLMYHRVLTSEELQTQYVQPGMYVLRSSFDRQIAFLKKNYRVLFLDELLMKITHCEDINGCCAITFDDGWLDNRTNAFPILEKHRATATIFLTTGFVDTDRLFWPEAIWAYLKHQPLASLTSQGASPSVLRFHNEIKKCALPKGECLLDKAIDIAKGFLPHERNEILEHYRKIGGAQNASRRMLTWADVIEMSKSGLVRFGAHTVEHEMLDQVPAAYAKSEISRSRHEIERRLETNVAIFAYPNGNHNKDVREIVNGCGIKYAVTTRKGFLGRDTLPLEIPRIAIHEDVSSPIPVFRSRILLQRF